MKGMIMKTDREILRLAYKKVLKKAASWAGVVSLLSMSLLATPASAAGQLTARSAVPTSSLAAATLVGHTVNFTLGTSGQTLGAIKIEICDSPLATVSCAGTGTSAGANFTGTTITSVTCAPTCSGTAWTTGAIVAGGATGTSIVATHTAAVVAGNGTVSVVLSNNATNPTAATLGGSYYMRVFTYNNAAANLPSAGGTDFGGIALATTTQMSVTANVQESLVFSVGTSGASCAAIANASPLSLSPAIMTTASASTGVGKLCGATNAATGYGVTYAGTAFTNGASPFGTGTFSSTPGAAAQFGFNLVSNATPSVGAAVVHGTGGVATANVAAYNTANSYSYLAAAATSIYTVGTPTGEDVFTLAYVANIVPLTQPGVYTATQTFVATGLF